MPDLAIRVYFGLRKLEPVLGHYIVQKMICDRIALLICLHAATTAEAATASHRFSPLEAEVIGVRLLEPRGKLFLNLLSISHNHPGTPWTKLQLPTSSKNEKSASAR